MDDDIVGFQIAMYDLLAVGFIKRGTYLVNYVSRRPRRQWALLLNYAAQTLAFNQFHHKIDKAIASDPKIINRNCIRMLKASGGLGLAPKSFACLWLGDMLRVKNLDCHFISDQQSMRAIDRAHATRP